MTVRDHIAAQPATLSRMVAAHAELTAAFVKEVQRLRPDRLYLFGSGTSVNAEATAAPFMEAVLGIEVTPVVSSHSPRLRGERPLLVFLSQGGASTNTLSRLQELSDIPHIAMTGEKGSPLEEASRSHMLIGCGPEHVGPKTLGYTASVLCLMLCALDAAVSAGAVTADAHAGHLAVLAAAAERMADNLERTTAWFERNLLRLQTASAFAVVEHGGGAVAAEGALKILETVRRPAIAYEFEEYLHGPVLVTAEHLAGLFFVPAAPAERRRVLELARCHEELSPLAFRIGHGGPIGGETTLDLLPPEAPYATVFGDILAPQVIASRLPEALGLDEGGAMFEDIAARLATKSAQGGLW